MQKVLQKSGTFPNYFLLFLIFFGKVTAEQILEFNYGQIRIKQFHKDYIKPTLYYFMSMRNEKQNYKENFPEYMGKEHLLGEGNALPRPAWDFSLFSTTTGNQILIDDTLFLQLSWLGDDVIFRNSVIVPHISVPVPYLFILVSFFEDIFLSLFPSSLGER